VWPASADPESELSLDWARRYVHAGATRLVVNGRIGAPDQLDALRHQLTRFREEVASRL
jgi:hypothetical protein